MERLTWTRLRRLGFFICFSCFLWLNPFGPVCGADPLAPTRKIAKEPSYQTKTPYYFLLAFGMEGKDLVWMVHDGDFLYVDRNGNGDLTEPGERIEREPPTKNPENSGDRTFEVGELKIGDLTHKAMRLLASPLKDNDEGDLAKSAAFRELVKKRPEGFLYVLGCDLAYPGIAGGGLGRRLSAGVGPMDSQGLLIPGVHPKEAPLIRLGGPIHIDFGNEKPLFRPDITTEVVLSIGFQSTGPGTFTRVSYDETIPSKVKPVMVVEGPPAKPGAAPYRESFELPHRCCGANLYGPVKVDGKSAPANLTATLSLPGWKEGQVVATRHSFTLLGAVSKNPESPVSKELIWSIPHPEKGDFIGQQKYSPDGKQLMLAGYPSGIVRTIDLQERKEIRRIGTSWGLRPSMEYAHLAPDWKTLLVAEETRGFKDTEEKGKKETLIAFTGKVQVWNFETGEPMASLHPLTGFGAGRSLMSPDGTKLLLEETSSYQTSDLEQIKKSQTAIWDWRSGERRSLGGNFYSAGFSGDSKSVFMNLMHDPNGFAAIQRFDLETGKAVAEYSFSEKDAALNFQGASSDGRLIAVRVTRPTLSALVTFLFLDAVTLKEVGSMSLTSSSMPFVWQIGSFSPDGKLFQAPDGQGNVHLFSTAEKKAVRVLPMENDSRFRQFSPDGKILAAAWMPKHDESIGQGRAPDPNDMPQPRITLHFLNDSTRPPATLIAPHGFIGPLAFRPDGNELAFGTSGASHLFSLTKLIAKP